MLPTRNMATSASTWISNDLKMTCVNWTLTSFSTVDVELGQRVDGQNKNH